MQARVARLSRCASLLCPERRGAGGVVDNPFMAASREAATDDWKMMAAAHAAAAICRPSRAPWVERSSPGADAPGYESFAPSALDRVSDPQKPFAALATKPGEKCGLLGFPNVRDARPLAILSFSSSCITTPNSRRLLRVLTTPSLSSMALIDSIGK